MQHLELGDRSERASWYRLRGDFDGPVQRWLVSTPETIDVCNRSELCGVPFPIRLGQGMTSALATAPFRSELQKVPPHRWCVMNFLRGSLNFDIRGALHEALGSRYP